jgi:hypothetical protein
MHQHHRAQGSTASAATPASTGPVLRQPAVTPPVPDHDALPEPTTSAGLAPVWHDLDAGPERPAAEPARHRPDGTPETPTPGTGQTPTHREAVAPAAAAAAAAGPRHEDVRAAARASLGAGRSPSLWWVCTGLVASVVVAWTLGAAEGAFLLAVLLAVSAVARAVLRRGPVALTVRSRTLDTAVLLALALGVGTLSQVIPAR